MYKDDDWKAHAGLLSDREISKRFGVGATTVRRYRKTNDIAEFCFKREPTQSLVERLAVQTDYSLSRDLGISVKNIKEARAGLGIPEPKPIRPRFQPLEGIWNEQTIALLGTMSDYELADRLKVSNYPVKEKRKELGIKAFKKPYPEISPALAAEFGMTSDGVLAERLGVSASFIRRARLRWQAKD
jgi:DNA-binding transcriptional MerR regulator